MLGCGNSKLSEEVRLIDMRSLGSSIESCLRCMTMGTSKLSTRM